MSQYFSYSQFREDVLLMRALHHVSHEVGFYIDVGANDPERESVTKVFYDHNWHGINIDASLKWVESLKRERTRDINIFAAVTDQAGEITFYDQPDGGLGTTVASIAEMHHDGPKALNLSAVTVPARTLTEICDEHVRGEIHFLKIDVEGGEGAVLRGMDFSRYRPWVMCIECHLPDHPEVQLFGEWESGIIAANYTFARTDTFNRYYVSNEHAELLGAFALPADDYSLYADVREIGELKGERDELRRRIDSLQSDKSELESQLAEAQRTIENARNEGKRGLKLW